MAAIISEKFRIFNAKQFLESLSEGSGDTDSNRSRMYFFVGRPQAWKAYLEVYGVSSTAFSVGEEVYVGASLGAATFKGTVSEVFPNSLTLTGIGPSATSAPTAGQTLTGDTSGATAKTGVYRYATEEIPTAPLDNQEEKYEIYDDLIAVKRITSAFARHVVRRYNWDTTINPKFDMWRPDYSSNKLTATGESSLGAGKYVVMNSQYEVFTCLFNGTSSSNLTGVAAAYSPTTTPVSGEGTFDSATGIFKEPSGNYIWKYIYTIPTDDVIKFLSSDFMPIVLNGDVQSGAVAGKIWVSLLKDPGANLPTAATLYAAIQGDGSGGKVKITTNGSGVMTAVEVEAGGTGYTYGNVVLKNGFLFTDAALTTTATVLGTAKGEIEVVIPPQGGHGADPVLELNSKRVMTNIRLTYSEGSGDFPVDNDFRRIGIIQDPLQFGSSNFLTVDNGSALFAVKVTVPSGGNFVQDEEIQQTNSGNISKGRVVSWTLDDGSTTSGVLKYYQSPNEHTFNGKVYSFVSTAANPIVGQFSTINGTVDTAFTSSALGVNFSSGLANPEIANNSGEIIYAENRRLITRAPDQIEDIKLVIEF
jgi:hypothetical protein